MHIKNALFFEEFDQAVPAILLEGSVSQPDSGSRASRVTLLAAGDDLWNGKLGPGGPTRRPAEGEIVINEPLAAELSAHLEKKQGVKIEPEYIPVFKATLKELEKTSRFRQDAKPIPAKEPAQLT